MRFSAIVTACVSTLFGLSSGCQPPPSTITSSTTIISSTAVVAQTAGAAPSVASEEVGQRKRKAEKGEVQLKVADLAGLEETIKSQSGKVVVVDIWSLQCAPCMREFPHLVELSKRYPERVACVSLNVDYIGLKSKPPESYLPKVQEFLSKQNALLTNLLSASADEKVLAKFKLESIPAILIYGPDGKLLHTLTDTNTGEDGLTYVGDVIPKIDALLANQK